MSETPSFPGSEYDVPGDAPDAIICAVDVVRSIIQPQQTPEDATGVPPVWAIYGVPLVLGDNVAFRLFGDLSIFDEGWFVGVTSAVLVAFRGALAPNRTTDDWPPELVDEYTKRYGPWASHVLYDVASACARRLSTQNLAGGPTVPAGTPPATLLLDT